jgi:hypothetical protein
VITRIIIITYNYTTTKDHTLKGGREELKFPAISSLLFWA